MKKILILVCLSLLPFLSTEADETSDFTIPKIQVAPIKDTQSDKQYELYIKLPEGYAKNKDKIYPVFYFTDALWHVELLSTSTEFLMEEVILVGVSWQKDIEEDLEQEYGAHVSRFTDYSFWKKNNPKHPKLKFGQANNHLDFIRNDVFKHIEQNYRASPNNRSYFGYSLSGLFGAYIVMTQPDTFKNYILGSPSVQVLTEEETKVEFKNEKLNVNVFISHGTLEEGLREPIGEFVTLLKARNDNSLSIEHAVIEGSHQTAFPMTGVRGVQWLSQMNNFPVEGDLYFGQKPPSLIPEIFAPGIVSIDGRGEGAISFSPDLDEVYFQAKGENDRHAIHFSKLEGNKWTSVEKADFTKGKKDEEVQPFVSPDGKRIYFTAFSSDVFDTGNWYVNRLDHSWSEAIKLDLPINDDLAYGSNQARNGTLYYFNISKKKNYSAAYINGGFPEPKEFEVEPGFYHALASPNEDYLVGHGPNREEEGREDRDIFVSFKEQDGTWAKPINLGNTINSIATEFVPTISPDGKYLFFGRDEEDGTSNIYWVSTEVIENLRPK